MMQLLTIGLMIVACASAAAPARYNCNELTEHRQFDFWRGDWEVVDRNGTLAGRDTISRNEHGCLLLERWRGDYGLEGQSINFYDPEIRRWRQIWISGANRIDIAGGWTDGTMTMEGYIYYFSNGAKAPFMGMAALV